MIALDLYNKLKHGFLRISMKYILKFHNLFYGLAGLISQKLEPDRLHPKHRILDYHKWFISEIKPEWSILDVGCGNGALTAGIARHCRKATGIDISEKNISQAKKRANAEFICADATNFAFDKSFDAIILSNVLEHIEDRAAFLEKLRKLSSRLLIRIPMIERDWITLYKQELGVEYRLDPTHFVEYTLEGFAKELNNAGLELESYRIRYGEIYAVATTI